MSEEDAVASLLFQGAHTSPEESDTPEPPTVSPWTANLGEVSGYRFVRFRAAIKGVLEIDEIRLPFWADGFPVLEK